MEWTKRRLFRPRIRGVSWRDLLVTLLPISLALAVATWAVLHFVRPAAPRSITISTGHEGSSFQRAVKLYAKAFARNGVTLHLRASKGRRRSSAADASVPRAKSS